MPHVTFPLSDLRALLGEPGLDLDGLEPRLELVKGELKRRHSSEEEVKVELQDTNRPDTWCVEGIARQLRFARAAKAGGRYAALEKPGKPVGELLVSEGLGEVRPYLAGFVARGYRIDDAGLKALVACQEVLSRNFGRMRRSVSIGVYDAARIAFPVHYLCVAPEAPEHAFVPLAPANREEARDAAGAPIPDERWLRPWTLGEILRDHPTGRTYAHALPDAARVPLLIDARGEVLSFPPIINSATLGRVTPGMDALFVEVTGTAQDQVLLAANILAANLLDRGAKVLPCLTRYPRKTARGREVLAPHPLPERRSVEVSLEDLRAVLGEPDLEAREVERTLQRFGVSAKAAGGKGGQRVAATIPAYRADYLHPVDAIEDFAIARGYAAFDPLMPAELTVGALSPATRFGDRLRDLAIGCGFEECIGNILTARDLVREKMGLEDEAPCPPLHGGPPVGIDNVMNLNYSVLRDWLLPTLLEVESRSTSALYPHRAFEVGEACVWDPAAAHRSRTEVRLAALLAHDKAGFSEAQAYLHALLAGLGVAYARGAEQGGRVRLAYALEPTEHPSFIPGRAAWIRVGPVGDAAGAGLGLCIEQGLLLGIIGEVHPAVLERWSIWFPCAGFELVLEPLRELLG